MEIGKIEESQMGLEWPGGRRILVVAVARRKLPVVPATWYVFKGRNFCDSFSLPFLANESSVRVLG